MKKAMIFHGLLERFLKHILGYGMFAIILYAAYRLALFILVQIELPEHFENFAITAFAITAILTLTSVLLRYDTRPVPKPIAVNRKEYSSRNALRQ